MYAHSDGARLRWEESGTGDPVLLIMGRSYPRQMWHRAIPVLARRFRVISYDHRGIGDSGRPPGPFTIADLARDAVAVLDAAGVDAAHVYGLSMGGLVAQELALSYPDRVRRLVLACTGGMSADKARFTTLVNLADRLPWTLLTRLTVPLVYGGRPDRGRVAADLSILRAYPPPHEIRRAQADAFGGYRSLTRLPGITAPTLVLHGDRDRIIPLAWGRELAETIPAARLVVLRGAGHHYLTDATDAANQAVLSFLDG
jgi:pimeloyl-ACP methyl ester carboxylesterase